MRIAKIHNLAFQEHYTVSFFCLVLNYVLYMCLLCFDNQALGTLYAFLFLLSLYL